MSEQPSAEAAPANGSAGPLAPAEAAGQTAVADNGLNAPGDQAAQAATEASDSKDINMRDAPANQASSPSHAANTTATTTATATNKTSTPTPTHGSSSMPPTTTTTKPANGGDGSTSSRAASAHPDSGGSGGGSAMPAEAQPHGNPTRQYLNSKVTTVLMEGLKIVAKERPKNPLHVLGEFLLAKSKELEKPATQNGGGESTVPIRS